ncbi:hypothetical protein ES708_29328 [subsurface metagenome]
MAEEYNVAVRVISQKGHCTAGHKVGDEWVIKNQMTPAGMCAYAFSAVFPFLQVLAYGAAFPWESNPDTTTVACPDAENPVVLELKTVKK